MPAAATINTLSSNAASPEAVVAPLVIIDGYARPDVAVVSIDHTGPLGLRAAVLSVRREDATWRASERCRISRLRGASLRVLQPIAVGGGEHRLVPMFDGRIDRTDQRLDAEDDGVSLHATCAWSSRLARMIESGAIDREKRAPWTVTMLLQRLIDLGGLALDLTALPQDVAGANLSPAELRGDTFADVLGHVCRVHHLLIDTSSRWVGHTLRERRRVIAGHCGRPIRLRLDAIAGGAGAVEQLRGALNAPTATRLVGHADGAVVESTFDLVPAWDPAAESLTDGAYGKSTSDDFDAVANVFRLWALNEDGAYSVEPFNRGAAFDLTSLFGDGRAMAAQALAFGPTLTMDEAGRCVMAHVELSTDAGATWTRYAGPIATPTDHAAVYLDDDALDTSYLDAARAGDARVRVTATLRSPLPLECVRWHGNPFAAVYAQRLVRAGDAFRHHRVAETSKYHAAVRRGQRHAAEADDRAAMAAWLAAEPPMPDGKPGVARLSVTGAALGVRVGDRLDRIAGRRITPAWADPATHTPLITVAALRRRFDVNVTEIECHVME
ncbi:MAG: hypothetical protein GC159_14375 [Phycisphaera sp.]|nr:hypothetical protein [Phycisphaera sp.]